ncbi:hypothetical protein UPYG_G00296670 [Umbra pygmaea]|uniref:Uncharacterized protein n=1 Tax=Umbra pygmaea TaxID=75934 RepID=A0ABD0W5S5_UMBPY
MEEKKIEDFLHRMTCAVGISGVAQDPGPYAQAVLMGPHPGFNAAPSITVCYCELSFYTENRWRTSKTVTVHNTVIC